MLHVLRFIAVAAPLFFAALPADAAQPCARPASGATATPPPDLYSQNGTLSVAFDYRTRQDRAGRTLFCFLTRDGAQSPTLHVRPGDTLSLTVTNHVPDVPSPMPNGTSHSRGTCTGGPLTGASLNVHFHGLNVAPTCHQDEVLKTVINSGQTYRYELKIPADEPPGVYWYHPHIHGLAEDAVLGGASGAIVVDGIENIQPAVAGLPSRLLIIRGQNPAVTSQVGDKPVPAWDNTLNYVPVSYPRYTPAVLNVAPGGREFWRVLNASAGTLIDVELRYDGIPQPLTVVGLDGVPIGSQDGMSRGQTLRRNHLLLAQASRAEFIITAPPPGTRTATFVTREVDTGPSGDADPSRPLAVLRTSGTPDALPVIPAPSRTIPTVQRFEGMDTAPLTARRHIYFSQRPSNPSDPESETDFFITVNGETPVLFDGANPPAIVTTQGAVEEWVISNRAQEPHVFHIHQIHFQLRQVNGVTLPAEDQQMLDTVTIPYWSGTGPYPSVTLRMDFRGRVVGDFVYHCHILEHEDHGMMAIIRVQPRTTGG